MAWFGADVLGAVVQPRAGGHVRPEARAVLATCRVVQVRQTEVVRELVREHTYAAVLGLDCVVTDPVLAVSDLDASGEIALGTGRAVVGVVRIPAMAPDRALAEHAAARFVALAGVE